MESPYKLRVVYVGELNEDMDDSMIVLAEKYGYELVSGGYETSSQERQLNFETKE